MYETLSSSPEKLLRIREVLALLGIRKSWLYKKIKEGKFPKPVRLSARCVAWRSSDIARWQNELAKHARG